MCIRRSARRGGSFHLPHVRSYASLASLGFFCFLGESGFFWHLVSTSNMTEREKKEDEEEDTVLFLSLSKPVGR